MATYDVDLLERLRERLAGEQGLSERAMFGGVALMLDGNMCVGVMKGGGLMVRLSRDEGEAVLSRAAHPGDGHDRTDDEGVGGRRAGRLRVRRRPAAVGAARGRLLPDPAAEATLKPWSGGCATKRRPF